jgi:CubicO group peptidase (beta-lactamase class C family)
MKRLLRWALGLFGGLLLFWGLAYLTGLDYLVRGVRATYMRGEVSATIDDARFFKTKTVANGVPIPWPEAIGPLNFSTSLDSLLEALQTVSLLIIQDDTIRYERYADNHPPETPTNSFSMAKSVTAMLTQIAIQQGYIQHWEQQAIDFIPELKGPYASLVTLKNLATMSCGSNWQESYASPFSITARSYYARNLHQTVLKGVEISKPPGVFEYQSGATQLLAIALERATGKNLADYNSEVLWSRIGAEREASYHTDLEGNPNAYCCLNSHARDFARLGTLLLHKGRVGRVQILDPDFVTEATTGQADPKYGYSIWIHPELPFRNFYFRGILGQYILMIPDKQLVAVRLGKKAGPKDPYDHPIEVAKLFMELYQQF